MKKTVFFILTGLFWVLALEARPFGSVGQREVSVSKDAVAEAASHKRGKTSVAKRMGARLLAKRLRHLARTAEGPGRKCAVILKQDGTEILAHVMTKDRKKVTYKPCDQPKGRSITLPTDSVRAIRMGDGWIWEPVSERGYVEGRDKAGNASLVLGIVSWLTAGLGIGFFLAIAGLVLGIVSLRRRFKRKGAAIAGIVLSSLLLLLLLVFIVALFLYWGF